MTPDNHKHADLPPLTDRHCLSHFMVAHVHAHTHTHIEPQYIHQLCMYNTIIYIYKHKYDLK